MTTPINLIVVCGTTASGKTRLGVEIAQRVDGEIISVDSRQVYRGMDIGTGKDIAEYTTALGTVPCHLIDIVDPATIHTLFHYQRDFYRVFDEIRSRGHMPVAVGGSGLYLEAVLKYYDIPNVAEDEGLRNELVQLDKDVLADRLRSLDPARFAKTDLSSKKRIVRSLEVAMQGVDESPHPPWPSIAPLVLAVRWDRAVLRERIRRRLVERLDAGMVDEVRRLTDQGVSRERLDLFGLEYRYVARFLANEISHETLVEELALAIGRFAKRQETWFRGMERRGMKMFWVDNAEFETAAQLVASSGVPISESR